MSTIVTRSGKGAALTWAEVDRNFTNLNTDKYQEGSAIGSVTPAAGTFTTLIGGKDQVNYGQLTGGATTKAVEFKTLGSDTNVALALLSQGTGAIDLAAGSSGVNISNGGTVTAITRTNNSGTYTSVPTVAISAPTTAGGVQATATAINMIQSGSSPTINNGGTGYGVGNVLTIVGGTPTGSAATMTVTAVSGGVITGVNYTNYATYSVLPTAPFSVTGGTGSGATFTSGWYPQGFTITNAGSGYVEQPTVTFSGGGGSGAAAYAVVGGTTTFKTVGSGNLFNTPAGTQFSFSDSGGATTTAWWGALGSTSVADFRTQGGGVTAGAFTTQTAVPLLFRTNYAEQMRVAHTASAVNYVQVTGAATGGRPSVSAQGSDTNIGLNFISKGNSRAAAFFNNSATSSFQFSIGLSGVTNAVNYLNANGVAASSSPELTAEGTDTNLDIRLTPKGTGNVRFGTLTASADAPITGYITIKDSGGTVRKLAVIA